MASADSPSSPSRTAAAKIPTMSVCRRIIELRKRTSEAALREAVAVGEQGFPETASLAELAAKARGVVVTLDESVIRERVATVRETLGQLGA